jgi:hypothetical protein
VTRVLYSDKDVQARRWGDLTQLEIPLLPSSYSWEWAIVRPWSRELASGCKTCNQNGSGCLYSEIS